MWIFLKEKGGNKKTWIAFQFMNFIILKINIVDTSNVSNSFQQYPADIAMLI